MLPLGGTRPDIPTVSPANPVSSTQGKVSLHNNLLDRNTHVPIVAKSTSTSVYSNTKPTSVVTHTPSTSLLQSSRGTFRPYSSIVIPGASRNTILAFTLLISFSGIENSSATHTKTPAQPRTATTTSNVLHYPTYGTNPACPGWSTSESSQARYFQSFSPLLNQTNTAAKWVHPTTSNPYTATSESAYTPSTRTYPLGLQSNGSETQSTVHRPLPSLVSIARRTYPDSPPYCLPLIPFLS